MEKKDENSHYCCMIMKIHLQVQIIETIRSDIIFEKQEPL